MGNATNKSYFFSHQKYIKKWKNNYYQQQFFLHREHYVQENIETYQGKIILLCLQKNVMVFTLIFMIKKQKNISIEFI